ncbi:MAG: hypothetical protein KGJ59_01860 [Bacteroidota bacterium]|nr:hypothetical protein [Bacteroidota bacterium]
MSKTKYVTHLCPSCGREAKMEIVGTMNGDGNKIWYRCTRCHHSSSFDHTAPKKTDTVIKLTKEECIAYSPEKSYSVGQPIYHTDWDDMGMVTAKEKTSSGGFAIVVAFEKSGAKRLIENLQAEV